MQNRAHGGFESFRPDWRATRGWSQRGDIADRLHSRVPGARRFTEDSTTAADGVGGGERSATTIGDLMETPGATARAFEGGSGSYRSYTGIRGAGASSVGGASGAP